MAVRASVLAVAAASLVIRLLPFLVVQRFALPTRAAGALAALVVLAGSAGAASDRTAQCFPPARSARWRHGADGR